MNDRLVGLDRQPEVPKPRIVLRELRIAQTCVSNLCRVLRLAEMIHGPLESTPVRTGANRPNGTRRKEDKQ